MTYEDENYFNKRIYGGVRFPHDAMLDDAEELAKLSGECVTVVPAAELVAE